MTVQQLLALLRREVLAPEPSTPGGRPLEGEALAHELGYRRGWHDRTERLIEQLGLAATTSDDLVLARVWEPVEVALSDAVLGLTGGEPIVKIPHSWCAWKSPDEARAMARLLMAAAHDAEQLGHGGEG